MPVLLQLQGAFKRYGDQPLLDDASVALADDQKVGLIGRNGAGKSTLCRILLGEEELDAGEVIRHRRLRLGYLRQDDPFEPDETVIDFLMRDSGKPHWRCAELAWRFDIQEPTLRRPIRELSGGWQTRVKLTGLLLHDPNFLILDEPTNFLDLRTQVFLERFLADYRAGCLVVSHDRTFLRDTCSHTLDLARGSLTMFAGTVDTYFENQRQQRQHDERVNVTIQAKRRQLETFINKNRGSPKTSSQARSKAKQLERLQPIDIDADESTARIHVPVVQRRRGSALRATELAIGYPDTTVASRINLDVDHGARAAVVGDNGQGKTTLLRTIAGTLAPQSGAVRWGHGCRVGIYAQHVYTDLPDRLTVIEYLRDCSAADVREQTVLDVAGGFLFSADTVSKRIAVLSGGERARLALAGLLLGAYNALVLDEPVNHLDVETVDALATALIDYQGTVLFSSHDRHFVSRVATAVFEVRDGAVAHYPDDYDAYVWRVEREIDQGLRDAAARRSPEQSGAEAGSKQRRRREHELRKRLASIERKVESLSSERDRLQQNLYAETDADQAAELHTKIAALAADLQPLERQWLELAEQLEER